MKTFLTFLILFIFFNSAYYAQIIDADGNTYNTVQIGNQTWMKENLRTSKYNNGDDIPNVTVDQDWIVLESGAWVHYDNDASYEVPYGKLYNWFVVNDARGVCPSGFHVPNQIEWDTLKQWVSSHGYPGTEGYALKATTLWDDNDGNPGTGDDAFGFSAYPAGRRYHEFFYNFGRVTYHWLSDTATSTGARHGQLHFANSEMPIDIYSPKKFGLSVRCVQNQGSTTGLNYIEESDIEIYPNPARNILFIELKNLKPDKIKIIDTQGKVSIEKKSDISQIDIHNLKPGLYFVEFQFKESRSHLLRFVKN